jgi:hypothetical protein
MTPRARILSFGSAGVLVIAGTVCAVVVSGGVGAILAMVLIGLGFVLATALVFLEVGLSEDRQLARDRRLAQERQSKRTPRPGRIDRPKLERSRGHRRRLS